jgi:SAM-dependent methyltransferase
MPATEQAGWYDFPQYYERFFSQETVREVRFIEWAASQLATIPVRKVLELGCGGGRLLLALARRGYAAYGVDNHPKALELLRQRAQRQQLAVTAIPADLADFALPEKVEMAVCTFNTFRHVLSERAARRHLRAVAQAVRPGGLYILGLHLLPFDVAEEDEERWSARWGRLKLHARLRVEKMDRRQRLEWLHVLLTVRSPRRVRRLQTRFCFRLYTRQQFLQLLRAVPAWRMVGVYDFWYDWHQPRQLDDELTDAVFVLRRQ